MLAHSGEKPFVHRHCRHRRLIVIVINIIIIINIIVITAIIIYLRKDQEGFGAARDVLRFQNRRRFPLQGAAPAEEEVHHCEFDQDDHDSYDVLFVSCR